MLRRPQYVVLGLVVLGSLALLSLPSQTATKFRLAISSLFLPLFGLASSAQGLADKAGDALLPRRALLAQLNELRREREQLRLRLNQGEEALRENARLRQIIGWQQQTPWRLRPARIIGRDPSNWWRALWIDLGQRDGLRADLPVVSADGLVGRVVEVAHTRSHVVLVGDPKCRVAVVVREIGEHGMLSASSAGVLDHRLVDLTHLPRRTSLRPGQTVYTSGLGGVFPAGIPVGTVVDSRSVGYGLYTEARVKLAADASRLAEVMVMFP